MSILSPALAYNDEASETPRPVNILDYDSIPDPMEGQHHYLLICEDLWEIDSDKEGNLNHGNTDGMLLVTFDTRSKRLLFTTISREILVQRPDGHIGRITFILKNYGAEALCKIIGTHFGVKVEKYIIFSMDNVQSIIEALGGVYITVTDAEADYLNRYRIARDSTTPSMDKAGTYLFGGHAALIYMRIRYVSFREGDAVIRYESGRQKRVRTVLTTLTRTFFNASLLQVTDVVLTLLDNNTETNMTLDDLVKASGYAFGLIGVEPEGLQLPPDDAMESIIYAGMTTRQVDYEMCRDVLSKFLDNSFLVMDD
jgi:LCP family protein required for cell wall assembly